jgi:hypothetical protein
MAHAPQPGDIIHLFATHYNKANGIIERKEVPCIVERVSGDTFLVANRLDPLKIIWLRISEKGISWRW